MDRRGFLQLGTGVAAGAVAGTSSRPVSAQGSASAFAHGVACGDPLPDGLIIWTRVTPSETATPGSGDGGDVSVTWQVALDDSFESVVSTGVVTTGAAVDHTVKVDVRGLDPDTEYRYRFVALGQVSRTGRGITAPAVDADVERLRFGMVSCSNFPAGYFSAYRHLAARDDLDAIVHLGDYIYESGDAGEIGRSPDPPKETVTLEDYRRRHALHKADPDLQDLHARYAFVVTIDDHEVVNNAYGVSGDGHDPATEGDYLERRAAAFQAYSEWMPIRADVHRRVGPADFAINRSLRFGTLAELVLLDLRTFRDRPPDGLSESLIVTGPEPADPSRTMLGGPQRDWLLDVLGTSETAWRLIGNSVMFAPLVIADLPDAGAVTELVLTALQVAGIGLPALANGDQWDGYRAEQAVIGDAYAAAGNVVVLTGDIHSSWAAEIPVDPGSYLPAIGGETVAVEFVTPATTSNSFRSIVEGIGVPGLEVLGEHLGTIVPALAPWIKYLDADRHGFGILEVTADATQYDWHHLADRRDPESAETFSVGFRTRSGTNTLEPAAQLGARPSRPPVRSRSGEPPSEPAPAASNGKRPLPATGGGGLGVPVGVAAALGAVAMAGRVRDRTRGEDR